MSEQTPTPRTDAIVKLDSTFANGLYSAMIYSDLAAFARQLERELAESQKAYTAAHSELERAVADLAACREVAEQQKQEPVASVIAKLVDAAFSELQHDTGPQDKEYVFQRQVLDKSFRKILYATPPAQDALDAKRWREHKKVMAQGRLPHALYMRFTAERGGEVWQTEAVLDAHAFGEQSTLGIEAVGLAAKQQVTKLFSAIDAAIKEQSHE